jgi:hypothetical protein
MDTHPCHAAAVSFLPELPEIGDAAGAVSALVNVGRLGAALRSRRVKRLDELKAQLEARLAELDPETIAERILDSPEIEDIVRDAVEAALRSAWEEKRRALGEVAVQALLGTPQEVAEARLLQATIDRIERAHVIALGMMTKHAPLTKKQVCEKWPEGSAVVEPVLSLLASEALIKNIATATIDQLGQAGFEQWAITDYGVRLLDLLRSMEPAS